MQIQYLQNQTVSWVYFRVILFEKILSVGNVIAMMVIRLTHDYTIAKGLWQETSKHNPNLKRD